MNQPEGLSDHGTRLWDAVTADFSLNAAELELLEQAARVSDQCAMLAEIVASEGVMSESRLGESKIHPAAIELRNERLLLGRLLTTLRVPVGGEGEDEREQKRGGFRGWHERGAA
jgi:hypothetical protein